MTREEAIEKVANSRGARNARGVYSPREDAALVVGDLIALGILKLDEPKTVEQHAIEALHGANLKGGIPIDKDRAVGIVQILKSHGLKIEKA